MQGVHVIDHVVALQHHTNSGLRVGEKKINNIEVVQLLIIIALGHFE